MSDLPPEFARTIRSVFGERGEAWLEDFPALLHDTCLRWDVLLDKPFGLSYSYAAPGMRAGREEVVLKLCVPNRELTSEANALRFFDGQGAVRLLEADLNLGALLLERIRPGELLLNLGDDDQATRIAAGMMRRLHRPLPGDHPFVDTTRWTIGLEKIRPTFQDGTGPFPAELVDCSLSLRAELLASSGPAVLLHGDLHHWNILSAQREPWLALDPKGGAGEAEYEVGVFLYNPLPEIGGWPDLERVLARRLDIFADELGFDRQRLLAWGLVEAVLSAWWSYEDFGDHMQAALAVAAALKNLMD